MAVQPKAAAGRRLPISSYQRIMLMTAADPETSKHFHEKNTVRWAFRIKPSVPERTLRRAFDKLVARHDSLRLRFVEGAEDWQAEILQEHPVGLMVEDISALPVEEQQEVIRARALDPMTAFSDPLFEMILFKGGKAGDVVLTRAQHAIIDGYSIVVLIEDLLKSVLNMPQGPNPPGHEAFMLHRARAIAQRQEEKDAFWRNALLPPPPDPNIGRKAKGLPPLSPKNIGRARHLDNILSAEQAKALEARVKKTGISAYSYLNAAFCETLCSLADQQEVIVNSVFGRKDGNLAGFVGAEMQLLGMKYRSDPTQLDSRAAWVAGFMSEAMEACPTDAFRRKGGILETLSSQGATWLRFLVHMPTPSGRLSNSPFKKLFDEAQEGKVALGFLSVERINLAGEGEVDSEIQFSVHQKGTVPNASLLADAEGYDAGDLQEIADCVTAQLRLTVA